MKTLFALTALSLALVSCGKDEDKRSAATATADTPPKASTTTAATPAEPASSAISAPGTGTEARGASGPATATRATPGAAARTGSGSGTGAATAAGTRTARGAGAATQPAAGSTHTVVRGDTLAAIARSRGVGAQDLAKWNGVRDPRRLRVGQELRLTPP